MFRLLHFLSSASALVSTTELGLWRTLEYYWKFKKWISIHDASIAQSRSQTLSENGASRNETGIAIHFELSFNVTYRIIIKF